MDVQLTPDQQALVRDAIKGGRLKREEDVLKEALLLWEERERRRLVLRMEIEIAEASLARGAGRRVTTPEEHQLFEEELAWRGMERMKAELETIAAQDVEFRGKLKPYGSAIHS